MSEKFYEIIDGGIRTTRGVNISAPISLPKNIFISDFVGIGKNVAIGGYVEIGKNVGIGEDVGIGENVEIGGDSKIGDGVTIGDEVAIGEGVIIGDGVKIGDGVTIGDGVIICKGVKIGGGAYIAYRTMIYYNMKEGTDAFRFFKLYKYPIYIYLRDTGDWIIGLGCHHRTISEWESDFYNNNDEFPEGAPQTRAREFAFDIAKRIVNFKESDNDL